MNSNHSVKIQFQPVTRDNWEEALILQVNPIQKKFVPSVAESLAAAYVKPWDEALDPYLIYMNDLLVGFFYLSYTPNSCDNYWIGGFLIDQQHQRKGYGKASLRQIMKFIIKIHPNCQTVNICVEQDNKIAQSLYHSMGFSDTGKLNRYGEIIYRIQVK